MTQIKCDGDGRGIGAKPQLPLAALIRRAQLGWEDIFRIPYAHLQSECVNIGVLPTEGCVQLEKK